MTMQAALSTRSLRLLLLTLAALSRVLSVLGDGWYGQDAQYSKDDISLWIDEQQVNQFFNGYTKKIFAIWDGLVQHLGDPNFEKYLPVIPSEVSSFNFTWKSGEYRNYSYMFDELFSFNKEILKPPVISIPLNGSVPRNPTIFQVFMPCVGNMSGIATFTLALRILQADTRQNLAGTPIRLKLQKQCSFHGPDPECDKKCGNGKCNHDKICVCPTGFLGKYCESALCYPQCMNGGTCVAPGVCLCAQGFQGLHCEGGICSEKCLNGGKCIQKDKCSCRRGYYGEKCQYSKCKIPCLNGSKCIGVNRCRCKRGFIGSQCHIKSNKPKVARGSKKKSKRKFI